MIDLLEYIVQSKDNADCVDWEMRFKYVDDLTVLELVMLANLLTEYNFKQHVASYIGIDEYLPAASKHKLTLTALPNGPKVTR